MKKLSIALLITGIGVAGSALAQSDTNSPTSPTHGPTIQSAPPWGGGEGGNKDIGGMPRSGSPNESNSTGNPGDKPDTSGASGATGNSSSTYSTSPSSGSSDTSGSSSGTSIDSTKGMSSDKGESGTPGDRTRKHNPPTQ